MTNRRALSAEQRRRFAEDGYLVLRDRMDVSHDIAPILHEYDQLVSELLQARDGSEALNATTSFDERVMALTGNGDNLYVQHVDISLPVRASLPPDTPIALPRSIFAALTGTRILDAVESILGPELAANPVQHVRIKPPESTIPSQIGTSDVHTQIGITPENGLLNRTPWHQDASVVTSDADSTPMLTVWLPITQASLESGCLYVIPGSHQRGLIHHCPGNTSDLRAADSLIEGDVRALPMAAGDLLLLHRHCLHSSGHNRSRGVRMSVDLRFNQADLPSGRRLLPSFVVRSRRTPQRALSDYQRWRQGWLQARAALANSPHVAPTHRWTHSAQLCA